MTQGNPGYEEVFLAIAVKNRLLDQEAARKLLASFRATAGTAQERPIQVIAVSDGLLKADQAKLISTAAVRKLQAATTPGAPSTSENKRTTMVIARRIDEKAGPPRHKFDPKDPFPGYRVLDKLGIGGTATVFKAVEKKPPLRQVALKVLLPQRARDERFVRQFENEARLLISFEHPNIVRGYDVGIVDAPNTPLYFFALELVEGDSVQSHIDRDGRLPEKRACEVILEAAKALEYIQGKGLIHRDIKPDNLMITKDGRIKILDLGFALPISGDGAAQSQEEEGTTSGTVQYMSPEQAEGLRNLDIRSDIYSLGATLYHMVVGDVPFSGKDSQEIMAKQVLDALNSSELKNRRTISRHTHYFIERMMSKDKDFRYSNPTELIKDITEQLEAFEDLQFDPSKATDSDVLSGLGGEGGGGGAKDKSRTSRFRTTTRRGETPSTKFTRKFRFR